MLLTFNAFSFLSLPSLILHPYAREIRISVRIRPRLCFCWLKFNYKPDRLLMVYYGCSLLNTSRLCREFLEYFLIYRHFNSQKNFWFFLGVMSENSGGAFQGLKRAIEGPTIFFLSFFTKFFIVSSHYSDWELSVNTTVVTMIVKGNCISAACLFSCCSRIYIEDSALFWVGPLMDGHTHNNLATIRCRSNSQIITYIFVKILVTLLYFYFHLRVEN